MLIQKESSKPGCNLTRIYSIAKKWRNKLHNYYIKHGVLRTNEQINNITLHFINIEGKILHEIKLNIAIWLIWNSIRIRPLNTTNKAKTANPNYKNKNSTSSSWYDTWALFPLVSKGKIQFPNSRRGIIFVVMYKIT